MWYAIPFIVLLVILLVLNKRAKNKTQSHPTATQKLLSKSPKKKPDIKTTHSVRTTQNNQAQIPVDNTLQKPIDEALKARVEYLIHEKQYALAEAMLNKELNLAPNTHELYLYLVDIHLLQHDELALEQLITYIRSLNLVDIYQHAEDKWNEYKTIKLSDTDRQVSVPPEQTPEEITLKTDEPVTNAVPSLESNHEHLIAETLSTSDTLLSDQDFKQDCFSQSETTTPVQEKEALEFVFNPSLPTQDPDTLDLDKTFSAYQSDIVADSDNQSSTSQIQLEEDTFAVAFEPNTSTPTKECVEYPIQPDTSLTVSDIEEKTDIEKIEVSISEQEIHSGDLDHASVSDGVNLDILLQAQAEPVIIKPVFFDPLQKEFPEILDTDEAQLNLDLAEHYIKLGAYQSAQQLLTRQEHIYSEKQREHSQKLLNSIAS
ncbi:hypothetical protein [Acinetobacter stercoris]|uniref:FimV domain-containing protein n=1 Tax=Acinetobacter stercoris TaxID=2126983 RepID=A0A2U3MYA2_9GAMM|nr:hypothetical protein [Acinetobacter stercoris]SPL70416.1 hypothetical protein KPC_1594 [Acinetobacter stercoris]